MKNVFSPMSQSNSSPSNVMQVWNGPRPEGVPAKVGAVALGTIIVGASAAIFSAVPILLTHKRLLRLAAEKKTRRQRRALLEAKETDPKIKEFQIKEHKERKIGALRAKAGRRKEDVVIFGACAAL